MTSTETGFIEFKSPIRKWNDCIFLGTFAFLMLLTFIIFGKSLGALYVFVLFFSAVVAYYLARHLSMAHTSITVNGHTISVSQSSRRLNKSKTFHFALTDVRGFEIAEITRGTYALILYNNSFAYYKYSLTKVKDQLAIKTFLEPHLQQLNNKANPLFKSFGRAFLFALKRIAIFQILALATLTALWWMGRQYLHHLDHNIYLIPLCFVVSLLFWWIFVHIPVQKHHFRFGAYYWGTNFFIYISIFFFFPIQSKINDANTVPLAIHRPLEIIKNKPSQLYTIEQLSYNSDSLLLANYLIKTRNKGSQYPIHHLFATPLGSGDTIKKNGLYNLWLVKSYTQKIRKTADFENRINNFHQQSRTDFSTALQQKPVFYELINDSEIRDLIQSSVNAAVGFNAQLEPHWESLETYRNNAWQQAFFMFLFFAVLNLIGAIFIAVNR